jgi:trk system potassium uptake protein
MRAAPLLYVVSVTLLVMGNLMLIPAAVGWLSEYEDSEPFLNAAAATLTLALVLYVFSRRPQVAIVPRQAFPITTMVWIVAALAGAVPIAFHERIRITDAFFESMSGITTTGSTILVGLDDLSPAILLWRSMLQWIGGLGFIVMAIAILPLVGVGGMRLFRSESSDWTDKTLPRTKDLAKRLAVLYAGLTMLCAATYWLLGMTAFDAVNHAMTTIATGGYSTSDLSMGKYASNALLWSGTTFMLLASLPFVLYLQAVRTGPATIVRDDQVGFFLRMVVLVVAVATLVLVAQRDYEAWDALTVVAFNAVSIMTTTGYASTDYTLWGDFFVAAFLFMMFTGGCSGSTAGSIKAFRLKIALTLLNVQIKKLVHPNGVFVAKLNGRKLEPDITNALVAFIFAVGITVIVVTIALTAMNIDFMTALSSAATAVTNVGPGLGPIVGPAGNFAPLPDGAKWLLSGAMLLGRLELMTVIVLLSQSYWRG